jgi:single-stranded-DNA-specific exonuclease
MQLLEKHWIKHEKIPPTVEQNLNNYPSVLRQLLYNREYQTSDQARYFLENLPPPGTQPENITGIPEAVKRIYSAVNHHEPIVIYGDYDVDGVTATALLVRFLCELDGNVTGYIPNRFDEGYGLNNEALESIYQQGTRLVVSVDCGIRSPEEASFARQLGLDMIITDHHQAGSILPEAVAVVNPKQPGDQYPDKDLAGVGLAYKLACGYANFLKDRGDELEPDQTPEQYLDLVALGTVSDLAPLKGENRYLVKEGLKKLNKTRNQGLVSLIHSTGLSGKELTATDIGFVLGPRLNASGRLDTAQDALNLLLTEKLSEAGFLAQKLEIQNRERQDITRQILQRAEDILAKESKDQLILFAIDEAFNPGVVGLVASRLTDAYYRPSIVAFQGPEFTRGSCRSIREFHITEALDQCADLLEHYGGHAAAAGFTVKNEKLDALRQRLTSIAQENLSQLDLHPSLHYDLEIPLSNLNYDLIEQQNKLQPTGVGNPQAVFVTRDVEVLSARGVGRDQAHLKMTVGKDQSMIDCIGFRMGDWANHLPPCIDVMYVLEVNVYNGRESLQLNLRDIRPA